MDGWIAASRAWEAVSITNPPRTTTPSSGRFLFEERTGTGYLWWQVTMSRHVKEGAWPLYAAAAAVW